MRWVVIVMVAICGCSAPPDDDPDPVSTSAVDLYGLRVGAKWTYRRASGELRWKEIIGCEDVVIRDAVGGSRVVRAYVRENRNTNGTSSVHYLVVEGDDVVRIRRDDIDDADLASYTTYEPSNTRLFDDLRFEGDQRSFDLAISEFGASSDSYHGTSQASVVDRVIGDLSVSVPAGQFTTREISRTWTGPASTTQSRSFYAPGVGEVREVGGLQPPEELIAFTPGYGSCEGVAIEAPSCEAPLGTCERPWGSDGVGCTDLRVDAENCGACGNRCASGVCANGECQVSECAEACEGSTICCPLAWMWNEPGCTSPNRDPANCGGCGQACAPNSLCDHGACVCTPGTADCYGDGICQSTSYDVANCGACGRVCEGASPTCLGGVCYATCEEIGLVSCDGVCVDTDWDPGHCGECGAACTAGTGRCIEGACETCEEVQLTECADGCVDTTWSSDNCGTCGNVCGPDQACVDGDCVVGDGTCGVTCGDGTICCGGVCINPRVSDTNCGGCGVATCAPMCQEACRNGACVPWPCGGDDGD